LCALGNRRSLNDQKKRLKALAESSAQDSKEDESIVNTVNPLKATSTATPVVVTRHRDDGAPSAGGVEAKAAREGTSDGSLPGEVMSSSHDDFAEIAKLNAALQDGAEPATGMQMFTNPLRALREKASVRAKPPPPAPESDPTAGLGAPKAGKSVRRPGAGVGAGAGAGSSAGADHE
jgi:hypothetical protein